eukprot:2692638-Prymnesium_polylepis.1
MDRQRRARRSICRACCAQWVMPIDGVTADWRGEGAGRGLRRSRATSTRFIDVVPGSRGVGPSARMIGDRRPPSPWRAGAWDLPTHR